MSTTPTQHHIAFSGVIYGYGNLAFGLAQAIIINTLLARYFGPDNFGIYKAIIAGVGSAVLFVRLGLDAVVYRFGSECCARGDEFAMWRLLAQAFQLRLFIALFVIGFAIWQKEAIIKLLGLDNIGSSAVAAGLAYFFAMNLTALIGHSALSARSRTSQWYGLKILQYIAVLIIVPTGIVALEWSISSVIWTQALLEVVVLAVLVLLTITWRRSIKIKGNVNFNPNRIKRFSIFSYFATLSGGPSVRQFEQLIISGLLVSADVGQYGLAVLISNLVLQINPLNRMREVAQPVLMRSLKGRPQSEVLSEALKFFMRLNMAYALPAALTIVLIGRPLLSVMFGPAYSEAYIALVLLTGAATQLSFNYPYAPILTATERPEITVYGSVFTFGGLLFGSMLAHQFGIEALAFGALLGAGTKTIYFSVVTRRSIGIDGKFPWSSMKVTILNCIPFTTFLLFIKLWGASDLIQVATVPIAVLLYLGTVRFNSPFISREMEIIGKVLPTRLARFMRFVT